MKRFLKFYNNISKENTNDPEWVKNDTKVTLTEYIDLNNIVSVKLDSTPSYSNIHCLIEISGREKSQKKIPIINFDYDKDRDDKLRITIGNHRRVAFGNNFNVTKYWNRCVERVTEYLEKLISEWDNNIRFKGYIIDIDKLVDDFANDFFSNNEDLTLIDS